MIPKVIHYCWFGGKEKPDIVKKCIQSWKKYCPDWKIIEWNETNFDISQIDYMKEAYELEKWAFVSDVARLLVIYRYGGIYLDTDVELLAPMEFIINNNAFFVFESDRNIATGLGFGAVKEHKSVKVMLDYYTGKHFIIKGKPCMIPCPAGNSESLQKRYKQFIRNGENQKFSGIEILSLQQYSKVAKHHGTGSWIEGPKPAKKIYKDTKLKRVLRSPDKFMFIEKHFGKKIVKIYTFIVYDYLELGPVYYIKRLIYKLKKI
jgi:mannosyltransferase OCH1-like enzyme